MQYLGEIKTFPYNQAPRGWMVCNGQILSIAQNSALFSLLGTTYGGNGVNNFALPNLQGKVSIHNNSTYPLGTTAGTEAVNLNTNEIPAHNHIMNDMNAFGDQNIGTGTNYLAQITIPNTATPPVRYAINAYAPQASSPITLAPTTISTTGGGAAHENRMPFLVMTVCIATQGIFPSRN